MPRRAREQSATVKYHVVLRGADRGTIDISQRDAAIIAGLNAGIPIRQLPRLTAVSKAVIESR